MKDFKVKVIMETSMGENQTVEGEGMMCFVNQGDSTMSSAVGTISRSMCLSVIERAEQEFPGVIIDFMLHKAIDGGELRKEEPSNLAEVLEKIFGGKE